MKRDDLPLALEVGRNVGPYVIVGVLGMGGMGAVYRARDTRLGRLVALKVVRPDRADGSGVDPEARLLAEAQSVAALRHPHVVEVYDAGVADGQTYVAMEYVEGKTLRAHIGDAGVPLAQRRTWLLEVASALAAAHRVGIVHRDVKPENVLVGNDGRARVLDFGIAKRISFDTAAPTADAPIVHQTLEGRVVGTAAYMAPEQLAGGEVDPKWDQFAWGVMAYELLAGKHPRQAVAMPGPTAHLTQTPPLPNELEPGLAWADVAAVTLAMSMDPSRRFASMEALLDGMNGASTPAPRVDLPSPAEAEAPPSRATWPLILLGLVTVAGGVGLGWTVHGAGGVPSARAIAPSAVASAPVTPSAVEVRAPTAVPVASVDAAAPPVASRAAVAPSRPEDYGTDCSCVGLRGEGLLCRLGSDFALRSCYCTSTETLRTSASGPENKMFVGPHLAGGQPCKGYDHTGTEQTGEYEGCTPACKTWGFVGLHRTPCRGLRSGDGVERDGLLFCY